MKITLDPGHTKDYNKGIIPGYYEGNAMFTLANYLKAELEKFENVEVFLTKDKREDNPELEERGKTAVSNGSELFISLHSNALVGNEGCSGVVGYYSFSFPESKAFLNELLSSVASLMSSWNRGAETKAYSSSKRYTDYYSVIRNSIGGNVKVSFIIKHGIHKNKAECKWLMNDSNLKRLAEAEAKVIEEHYGLKRKSAMIYRVQLGAFLDSKNADAMLQKLKSAGFTGFVKTENI